jgi:hypothetical protein
MTKRERLARQLAERDIASRPFFTTPGAFTPPSGARGEENYYWRATWPISSGANGETGSTGPMN